MEATYEVTEAERDAEVEQLQPSETLIDRGVDDALDEGIVAPDRYSPAQGYGNTPREMREGETLDMRIKQEVPDVVVKEDEPHWNSLNERREVGSVRAGRIIGHAEGYDAVDDEAESVGQDVGIAGGAACAEEAAMHIIDEFEDQDGDEDSR